MSRPTYEQLYETVVSIASLIMDGEEFPGRGECPCGCGAPEHEMTIDEAFDTASECISSCRSVLGSEIVKTLKLTKPNEEF